MNDSVKHVLIRAKEMNKWVSLKHFPEHQMNRSLLRNLEDEGYLLIYRHVEEGTLMKLTMKGYHRFKQ
ncbi:hypothetical protein ACIQ4I_15710 [Rummeliibacillus sp. NPDC094406]|uniref:hypothetical protein n=1 Tax=Rummeliibacillus sp. NPDC094406 TaxID=3364511 RepID=UPI00381ECCF6